MRKCDFVAEIYNAALHYDADICTGGDCPALVPLLPSGPNAATPRLT